MNTDCKKCEAPMPPPPIRSGILGGARFITTSYRCAKCGHWNDLKRRKGYAEYKAAQQGDSNG